MILRSVIRLIAWAHTGGSKKRARRGRVLLGPVAESLEVRACLSGYSTAAVVDRVESAGSKAGGHLERSEPVEMAVHRQLDLATPLKKGSSSGGPTIRVKPGGKANSLATVLKNAKPGSTIILQPGTYTQNLVIKKKSNLTIIGAAGQTSILAPASGDAMSITLSTNITVENIWFRSSGTNGRGVIDVGSSVTLDGVKTDGTTGDGAYAVADGAIAAKLTANSSQFDGSFTGDGMDLRQGSVAVINGSTFDGNGAAPNAPLSSDGLVVGGNAQATIAGSQFNGNTNAGLVALQTAQVAAQGSTFSGNQKGDGALFLNQTTVNLSDNSFDSNGEITSEAAGLNGIEFEASFTGTAIVSGNTFDDNTSNGVFIGGAPNPVQIVNNTFAGNIGGISMDSTLAPVSAIIEGNLIAVPVGSPDIDDGVLAFGSGVTATIGGAGVLENTIENYDNGNYILQADVSDNVQVGFPNDTILANSYLNDGTPVAPSVAITS